MAPLKINVVLLGHKAQVGKDTLADLLVNNDKFVRLSFAEKLKNICKELFDLSESQVNGSALEKNRLDERFIIDGQAISSRRILQLVGQNMRAIQSDVWAKYVFKQISDISEQTGQNKFVISDCRFPNEIDVARAWEAEDVDNRQVFTARIDRKSLDKNYQGSNDVSETALDNYKDWDIILDNDDSIEDLYMNFSFIYERLSLLYLCEGSY